MIGDVEAVIFDLDGVLCFTDNYHFLAWREVAESLSIKIDDSFKDRIRGISRMDSLEILLGPESGKFSDAEKQEIADRKNALYRKMLETMGPDDKAAGAEELLENLRKRGLKLAVGSSSRNTGMILDRIGLDGWFDAVSDGTMVSASKPDPEVFLKAASLLGTALSRSAVVEDAYMGIEAAVRGGFIPIAIGNDAARHPGALYRVSCLSELIPILCP